MKDTGKDEHLERSEHRQREELDQNCHPENVVRLQQICREPVTDSDRSPLFTTSNALHKLRIKVTYKSSVEVFPHKYPHYSAGYDDKRPPHR